MGTEQEFSAFNQAIIGGQLEIAQLLLDGGVDPNVQDDTLHNTPLMVAAMFNKLEIARLLLERGADTMLTNFIGQTALQLARESNNKAMIALIEGFNQQKMSE